MKPKESWERGYIPPRPVKVEPEVPAGWTLAAKLNGCRVYVYTAEGFYGPQAEIRGLHNNWSIWYKTSPWVGSLPSDGVFRGPDMRAGSLAALAVWWEIERENLPQPATGASVWGSVTGRLSSKLAALGRPYKMGATAFSQQLAKGKGEALHQHLADALRYQTKSDPRLMETMDFRMMEQKLIGMEYDFVVIDEVVTNVKPNGDRAPAD